MRVLDIKDVSIKIVPEILYEFACNSPYALLNTIDKEHLTKKVHEIVDNQEYICKLLFTDSAECVGIMFGVNFEIFYFEEKWNQEFAWYVKPDYRKGSGKLLLSSYEDECYLQGVKKIMFSVMNNPYLDRVTEFMEANGYKYTEKMFTKVM